VNTPVRRHTVLSTVAVSAFALTAAATQAQQKPADGPEATYWMSTETVSGMAAGAPSGVARRLQLQLGSSRRASGQPTAEHLPPSGLQAGASLPLVTPSAAVGGGAGTTAPSFDPSQLKGRMLIYWGCGELARPGQPLTVDFATAAAGKGSPLAGMLSAAVMTPPAPGRQATYGEWPNKQGGQAPSTGSLVGEHAVRGNYTPEMRFAVAQANDFLGPLSPTSARLPSGAVRVSWPALDQAKGYVAGVMGSAEDGAVVLWSSSEVKMMGAALPDYLAPGEIARLVQQKALMGPQTTECTVPAEVVRATRGAMLQMTAFGPEANYVAPRGAPADWAVKLRSKATHMAMLGGATPGATARAELHTPPVEPTTPPKAQSSRRGLILKGLGAALGNIP
jgi:hypothetical protein